MKRKSKKPLLLILGLVVIIALITIKFSGPEYYFEGNVRHFTLLSLVQENSKMDCDAFNQISVTYNDGIYKTLANGRQGLTPFIDDAIPLDLTHDGKRIDQVHFEVALYCEGKAMTGETFVSGQVFTRICGDPDKGGTTCLVGAERHGIEFQPLSISKTKINEKETKVIHTKTYNEQQILDTFNNKFGTIFFKHESFPDLNFEFNHPTAGSFTGSYNAMSQNSKIVAQYGLIENTGSPGKSDPQKPKPDPTPSPTNKGLRINWWTPQILDISVNEDTVNLSVGIENLDLTEVTPTIKIRKLDGFLKDEFPLPTKCIVTGYGWNDCETSIKLDIEKYSINSYKLELSTDSRVNETATVPLEIVDMTPPPDPTQDDLDGDGIVDSIDQCPNEPETINGYLDSDGCPDEIPIPDPEPGDIDGDGILDKDDLCPEEPETFNDFKDTDGCPDTVSDGGSGGGSSGGGGGFIKPINDLLTETIVTDSGVTITRSHTPQLLAFGGFDNQTAVIIIIGSIVVSAVVIGRFGNKF